MRTYTLRVAESETEDGLDVDVYDGDGTIEASTWISYADHGVVPTGDPQPIETEFAADVLSLDLQVERDGKAFVIRMLGDGEEPASERLPDEEWELADE